MFTAECLNSCLIKAVVCLWLLCSFLVLINSTLYLRAVVSFGAMLKLFQCSVTILFVCSLCDYFFCVCVHIGRSFALFRCEEQQFLIMFVSGGLTVHRLLLLQSYGVRDCRGGTQQSQKKERKKNSNNKNNHREHIHSDNGMSGAPRPANQALTCMLTLINVCTELRHNES